MISLEHVANALFYHPNQQLNLADSSSKLYCRPSLDQPWELATHLCLQPHNSSPLLDLLVRTASSSYVFHYSSSNPNKLVQLELPSSSTHPLFHHLPTLPSVLHSQNHTLELHPLLDTHSLTLEASRTLIRSMEPTLTYEDTLPWSIPLTAQILPRWPNCTSGAGFVLQISYSSPDCPQLPYSFRLSLALQEHEPPKFGANTTFADHLLTSRLLHLLPHINSEWIAVQVKYPSASTISLVPLPPMSASPLTHLPPYPSALLLSCYNLPMHTTLNKVGVPTPMYNATAPDEHTVASPLLQLTAIHYIGNCPPLPLNERLNKTLQLLEKLSTQQQIIHLSC